MNSKAATRKYFSLKEINQKLQPTRKVKTYSYEAKQKDA